MNPDLSTYLQCPKCGDALHSDADRIECSKCGHRARVVNGIPHFSEVPADVLPEHTRHSPTDQGKWTHWRRINHAYIADVVGVQPPGVLAIDVGAGESPFRDLLARYPRCLCLDFYPYEGIDVVCNLTQKLPVRSGIADMVLLSNVLEHMSEPEATLQECGRLLRPGGQLVLTVPFLTKTHQPPYDYYRYTHYGLEYLLGKAGFSQIEVKPLGDLFEVQHSINIATGRLVKRLRNPILRLCARGALSAMRLSMRLLMKLCRLGGSDTTYKMGLVKGFGCVARK